MSLLAFLTIGVLARCPVARALEMDVAFTPCPAQAKHKFLPIADEIHNRNCRLPIADRQLL
jgi:hypothetical protein